MPSIRKQRRADETKDRTQESVTMMRPGAPASTGQRVSAFPEDLFEQARGRLRLLAAFFFWAFLFDVLLCIALALFKGAMPPVQVLLLPEVSFLGSTLSAIIWWAAKNPRISAARIHTAGLVYEVIICAIAAASTYYTYYNDTGLIPNLTWVPAIIIMFPLVMPGPPRKMLLAAIASGSTTPLSLLVLELWGKVDPKGGTGYAPAIISCTFAVLFAYMGARVIYRLGREVAIARALGSYQLEEKLGEGGMGEVWRATHRMLARPAAVKLIRPDLIGANPAASEEARQRFEREARVIASLRSPHTVDLFDFGISGEGAFYYAMELLDGLDADALVRRFGPVPAERAVHILQQVCHSLAEAEARGLVHRDIKPSNIYVCRYGEDYDFVKVLDFGIVKMRHDATGREGALTRETVIRGTPAFMAPEQALGEEKIDGRADIYSLGCVAYWLLTGQLVFSADTQSAILLHHIKTPPSAPSTRTELPVPDALDRVVLSCLAKNPSDRPQTARDLAQHLSEIGVSAWTEERQREWWKRHQPASPRD
jgi:eukaryotic-like serine/threonine-protein kinase